VGSGANAATCWINVIVYPNEITNTVVITPTNPPPPPTLVSGGLAFQLDSSKPYGPWPTNTCSMTTWEDLTQNTSDAGMNNFACTASSGWNGTGVPASPYRLEFDGTNDFLRVADTPVLHPTEVTVCAWVKMNSQASNKKCGNSNVNYQYIAFKRNHRMGGFEGFALVKGNVGNSFVFQVTSSEGVQGGVGAFTATQVGQWYYTCGSFGYPTARIYVNGAKEGSGTHAHPLDIDNRPLFIGRSGECGGNGEANWDSYFNGAIADVQIYNRVLSDDEVFQNCQASEGKFTNAATSPLCHRY
jgi:hypothetical protein